MLDTSLTRTRDRLPRAIRRRSLLHIAVGSAATAFLAACGRGVGEQASQAQATGTRTVSGAGGPSGTITVAVGEEPPSFDVHRATGGVYNHFTTNVFEGLLTRDTKGKIVPALAESWEASQDGRTYEFRLRRNVKFHNGDQFTAEDVRFSYERLKNPKVQPKQSNYANWEGVSIVDDYTVRLHLKQPDPTFIGFISQGYNFNIVPSSYVQKVGDDGFEKKPVGTGPYKFVQRRVKESWELEAFPDYWGGAPSLLKATFRVIPEASTAEAALEAGEVDLVANYPPPSYARNKDRKDLKFILNPASNTIDVRINLRRQSDPETGGPNPFLDKRVRQAMAYAVDRDAIIKSVLGGVGEKIAVLFPEDPGYDPNLKPYPYDPGKAKALLAAAGYPSGFDTKFYGLLGERIPMITKVGEAVAQYFTAVGIRTKVINEDYALWLNRTSPETEPELWPMGIGITFVGGAFHPAYGFRVYTGCKGSTSWICDQTLERLIGQMYSELDPRKVEEYARQAAEYVHEEALVTVIYRNVNVYAMKAKVDFLPTAQSQYVELRNVRLRP